MAKASEAQRKATAGYKERNIMRISVDFNRNTEPELYKFMESYEGSKPALLRESLREHIERQ